MMKKKIEEGKPERLYGWKKIITGKKNEAITTEAKCDKLETMKKLR